MMPSFARALSCCANQALDDLRLISGRNILDGMNGYDLLQERATLMKLIPKGQVSANGSCHLLRCNDSWIALNLCRDIDWQLLPALFQCDTDLNTVEQVSAQALQLSASTLVERANLLGLALAEAKPCSGNKPTSWFNIICKGERTVTTKRNPQVLDLSSLWAGPLCSRLLQLAGADVIKIESKQRPDGARLNTRSGGAEFFQLLNTNKKIVELDFKNSGITDKLKKLIEKADIVIEGSRPRALQQLGINADKIVQEQAGLVWISITGYGRDPAQANRVAFGDDAAISAGLFHESDTGPEFIGDAIADPLTGLHAALAAYKFWQSGEAVLIDINLHTVARYTAMHLK